MNEFFPDGFPDSVDDLKLLRESVQLECKLAAGRDGSGSLPEDFWPTYSAFANTDGGIVILGMKEKSGSFDVVGIRDSEKLRSELFNNLNNRKKVSANLLLDQHVKEWSIDGHTLLVIEIPRANRKQRPVHLTSNPLDGHTFRRQHASDQRVSDEDVKRMLAEQVEDSRDDRILAGYDIQDLNGDSLRTYRQVFSNREPNHPWNELRDGDFLVQVGGWRRDRQTGLSGLTQAGLLMFGEMSSIQNALPYYMLDYQERPETRTENRWIDRLTLDGKWSGNLYDFYRRVYLKLTADLKVPFVLQKGERQDETPVHVALREALANVLVHADYSDRASVLVVKRPDMFGFRNPGLMRIPVEIALKGGEPDCRNRILHKMFRFVGVGEQAGTGIPRIFQGWQSQSWSPPKLHEATQPYNQTLLELRMIDMLPEPIIQSLRSQFGNSFDGLSHDERIALALAAAEGSVNHARLCTISALHRVDISRLLQHLTQQGMLESTGGRGAVYHLPGQSGPNPEDVFGPSLARYAENRPEEGRPSGLRPSSLVLTPSSQDLAASSSVLTASSQDLAQISTQLDANRDEHGHLVTDKLPRPVVDNLELLSDPLRQSLHETAHIPREKRKVERKLMESVITELCDGRYITLQCLSVLVSRKPESLRNEYLSKMVRARTLSLAFPKTPTHERQAYCATSSLPPISDDSQ